MSALTPEERQQLLDELGRLAHGEAENAQDQLRTFLPLPAHRLALRAEVVVIRGERGVGKSALFSVLNTLHGTAQLRRLFGETAIPEASWVDGYSELHPRHPHVVVVDRFAQEVTSDLPLRAFWMAHLLRRLAEELKGIVVLPPAIAPENERPEAPFAWIRAAEAELDRMAAALDQTEQRLEATQRTVYVVYDHLDRIGAFDHDVRRRSIGTLMALWLSLSNRYRRIRGKLLLREDLFDAAELGFPDASKLRARSVPIEWDLTSLFRMVVRHLAAGSEAMRAWLMAIPGLELREQDSFGWMPGPMPEAVQKAFMARLAGAIMGKTGLDKAATYQWIPNRLKDAHGRIVPRSLLSLLGLAAEHQRKHPAPRGAHLLSQDALYDALEEASVARIGEMEEEYPVVRRIGNLAGLTVPMPRARAEELLGRSTSGEAPGLPSEGKRVLDKMIGLGVLHLRPEEMIDIPDIYRYALNVRRQRRPLEQAAPAPWVELEQANALRDLARDKASAEADRLFSQALEKYRSVIPGLKGSALAWWGWGKALLLQGTSKAGAEADRLLLDAEEKLRRAVDIEERLYVVHTDLGDVLRLRGERQRAEAAEPFFQRAEAAYAKALALRKDWCDAIIGQARVFLARAQRSEGETAREHFRSVEACCQRAAKAKEDYFTTFIVGGEALVLKARRLLRSEVAPLLRDAHSYFRRALQADRERYHPLVSWAMAYDEGARRGLHMEARSPEESLRFAMELAEQALRIEPDLYLAHDRLGQTLTHLAALRPAGEKDDLFQQAIAHYQRALYIQPDLVAALSHWGATLLAQAENTPSEAASLRAEAVAKFEEAVALEPMAHEALAGWGRALSRMAVEQREPRPLLSRAEEKLHAAERIMPGSGAFALACLNAIYQSEDQCRRWFERAFEYGHVPPRSEVLAAPELQPFHAREWFRTRLDSW